MRVSGDLWTEDQVAQITRLWAEGMPCSRIAETMGGVSRNAVIGKARRLHLEPRARSHRHVSEMGGHARRSANGKAGTIRKARKAARVNGGTHPMGYRWTGPKEPAALPEDIPAPGCDPVSLLLRNNRQCSFIGGEPNGPDTLCCGAKVERRGLCRHHLDLCWYKPVKQRRTAVFGLIGLQAKARAA